jgi:uncharacterized protein YjbI with pentapeptide repeats
VNQEDLTRILELHKLWLDGKPGGTRAKLVRADLSGAKLIGSDLSGSDLSGAVLVRADLSGATLTSSNLDFSAMPLSCSGLNWKIDRKIFCQLAYHLCSMQVEDANCKDAQDALTDLANEMHRRELPRLKKNKGVLSDR